MQTTQFSTSTLKNYFSNDNEKILNYLKQAIELNKSQKIMSSEKLINLAAIFIIKLINTNENKHVEYVEFLKDILFYADPSVLIGDEFYIFLDHFNKLKQTTTKTYSLTKANANILLFDQGFYKKLCKKLDDENCSHNKILSETYSRNTLACYFWNDHEKILNYLKQAIELNKMQKIMSLEPLLKLTILFIIKLINTDKNKHIEYVIFLMNTLFCIYLDDVDILNDNEFQTMVSIFDKLLQTTTKTNSLPEDAENSLLFIKNFIKNLLIKLIMMIEAIK